MSSLLDRFRSDSEPVPLEGMTLSEVFDCLKNPRRRHVIDEVDGGEYSINELTDSLADAEFGDEPTGQERKRIYVSLHQTHLRKLRRYDIHVGEDREMRPGPNHAAVKAAMGAMLDYVEPSKEASA